MIFVSSFMLFPQCFCTLNMLLLSHLRCESNRHDKFLIDQEYNYGDLTMIRKVVSNVTFVISSFYKMFIATFK